MSSAAPVAPAPPTRIYLVFTLDITPQNVAKLLTECANWANQGTKEIYLLFASLGGNVPAGIAAYNVLRSLPVKLITHNIGNMDSIANIMFLAGEERLAVPQPTFMFHGVFYDTGGAIRMDRPYVVDRLNSIDADHKKMAAIINERAKFGSIDEVTALFRTQATKENDFALEHGLIHKVGHPAIPAGSRTLVFSP